jgi:hypothetical protein
MSLPDLGDPRTPTWPELQLDGHVRRVWVSLGVYVVSLALVWTLIVDAKQVPESYGNLIFYLAAANFLFLVWSAARIQNTLHESGLHEYAGWRVWAGALLLNPLFLGWWMPMRVLLIARGVRRDLEARWPSGRRDDGRVQS